MHQTSVKFKIEPICDDQLHIVPRFHLINFLRLPAIWRFRLNAERIKIFDTVLIDNDAFFFDSFGDRGCDIVEAFQAESILVFASFKQGEFHHCGISVSFDCEKT